MSMRFIATRTRAVAALLLCRQRQQTTALSLSTMTASSQNFRVVHYESGQTSQRLPIFAATPEGASALLDGTNDGVCRDAVQRVDHENGIFVLHNVLSPAECRRIMQLSDEMGYTEDAPVSLGRNIRRNENCVWIMDDSVNSIIFERARHLLPQSIDQKDQKIGPPVGLNRRWRLYKYGPDDVFKFHTDGAWTGSGIDEGGNYVDDLHNGTAISWLTFLIYLNDDFSGGNTSFVRQQQRQRQGFRTTEEDVFDVEPTQGSVLCFFHGHHSLSPLHQGSLVTEGTKYVARTDVLYKSPQQF